MQSAIERATQASAERAKVDRVKAIMARYAATGRDMSVQERGVVAAANVDTFAGMGDRTGEVPAAMRNIGYGGPNWT